MCSNDPLELVLATTDVDLYDVNTNKWLWDGTMYWSIQCLENEQDTVSDLIKPNISTNNYMILDKSPIVWDFCKSKNCKKDTRKFLIVFTFNPNSNNPYDFLQYVLDLNSNITDIPTHNINDKSNNPIFFDVTEINRLTDRPYLEFWIVKSRYVSRVSPQPPDLTQLEAIDQQVEESNANLFSIFSIIFLIFLFIFYIVFSGIYYYKYSHISK